MVKRGLDGLSRAGMLREMQHAIYQLITWLARPKFPSNTLGAEGRSLT